MNKRQPYTYVILRYRHDPVSGEQLNVGVVLHSATTRYLGASIRKGYGRLSKAFPNLQSQEFRYDMVAIERSFERLAKKEDNAGLLSEVDDAAQVARRVLADDDGSLIWSEVRSGLTSDPQATLATLFDRFVSQYEERSDKHRSDADVWRPVRDRLIERQLADVFEPKTIRSSHDEVQFEHAWRNGEWRCFQPLSFDLATVDGIQDKAAKWAGHMVGLSNPTEPFRPYFVVGAPKAPELLPAYERALGLLGKAPLEPEVVREDQLDEFLNRLEDEIREHQAAEEQHLTE